MSHTKIVYIYLNKRSLRDENEHFYRKISKVYKRRGDSFCVVVTNMYTGI